MRTAHMVCVKVGDDEMVYLRDIGIGRGRSYANRIPIVESWPSCIDKEGFAGWRHKKCCFAAFHVDHIDV